MTAIKTYYYESSVVDIAMRLYTIALHDAITEPWILLLFSWLVFEGEKIKLVAKTEQRKVIFFPESINFLKA